MFSSRLTENFEKAFEKLVDYHTDDTISDPKAKLSEMRSLIMKVHMEIHAMHRHVDGPFENLVQTAKAVLNPMVEVLKVLLKQVQDNGEKKVRSCAVKSPNVIQ